MEEIIRCGNAALVTGNMGTDAVYQGRHTVAALTATMKVVWDAGQHASTDLRKALLYRLWQYLNVKRDNLMEERLSEMRFHVNPRRQSSFRR